MRQRIHLNDRAEHRRKGTRACRSQTALLHAEMSLDHLTRRVREIEADAPLDEPGQLQRRIEALDRLEAYLFPFAAPTDVPSSELEAAILDLAGAIRSRLNATNADVYAAIRDDIRQGRGRDSLLRWLPCLGRPMDLSGPDHESYDYLDDAIAGVLQFEEPETKVEPAAEMVPYQPTPARHIFDLLERTGLTEEDVLVDIGAGLGHVPILTSIWTRARSVGVELEPAYVACARRAAESLKLSNVTFVQQDARAADFAGGTVFYLYTPFRGAMLRAILDLLRQEANTRPIRVCTFGPCTPVLAAETWLDAVDEARPDRIAIFRSRSERC
jgi:hypothetical protein